MLFPRFLSLTPVIASILFNHGYRRILPPDASIVLPNIFPLPYDNPANAMNRVRPRDTVPVSISNSLFQGIKIEEEDFIFPETNSLPLYDPVLHAAPRLHNAVDWIAHSERILTLDRQHRAIKTELVETVKFESDELGEAHLRRLKSERKVFRLAVIPSLILLLARYRVFSVETQRDLRTPAYCLFLLLTRYIVNL